MWLTKQRAQPGPVFGHADKFEGLGLFVDTYKNNRPGTVFPYIMAMNGDGNTPYDKDNDGKANEVAATAARTLATSKSIGFNPLFIHGGTGRGKTNLLHAIGHTLVANNSG